MSVLAHLIILVLIDHPDDDIRKNRIQLCALSPFDLAPDNSLGKHISIASAAAHGIIGVGNCNDPGLFRNLSSFEPVGIALAVIAFMMPVGSDGHS